MISVILLLVTITVIIADVLIGVFRGTGFGLLRLVLWVIGTLISALISKSIAMKIVLAVASSQGFQAESISELTVGRLAEQMDDFYATMLGAPAAGLILSLAVPAVFVALFIIFKLISWIIYLILKIVIKHLAKKKFGDYKKLKKNSQPAVAESASLQPDNGVITGPADQPSVPAVAESASLQPDSGVITGSADQFAMAAASDQPVAAAVSEQPVAAAASDQPVAAAVSEQPVAVAVSAQPDSQKKAEKPTGFLGFFVNKPAWSRIAGGVLGLFTALYALAIIASPVTGLVSGIDNENVISSAIHLVQIMDSTDFDTLKENALPDGDATVVEIQDELTINDRSWGSTEVFEEIRSVNSCFAVKLCTISGAKAVSMKIYGSLATVTPEELGIAGSSVEYFNAAETLGHFVGIIPRIDTFATALCSGEGFSENTINAAENVMFYVLGQENEGELISNKDKTKLVNSVIEKINSSIRELLNLDSETQLIPLFENYDEILDKIDGVFEFLRKVVRVISEIDLGSFDSDNTEVTEYKEIVSEPETVYNVIDAVLEYDGVSDSIAEVANDMISDATDGSVSSLVKPEGFAKLKGDEATQQRVADTIADLSEYMDRDPGSLSVSECDRIYSDMMYLSDVGILDADEAYEFWRYLGE